METGSNILGYTGNANLAAGTANNGEATGAPTGVLNIDDKALDNLAHYTFLKNKEAYDAQKKDIDTMYANALKEDFSTGNILEIDREKLDQNIKTLAKFSTDNPYIFNPKTPEQVAKRREYDRMKDELYTVPKAQAQVRTVKSIEDDAEIAKDFTNREERKAFKDSWVNTPFKQPLPYQMHYTIDPAKFAGDVEELGTKLIDKNNPIQTSNNITTNLNTTVNKIQSSLSTDKQVQNVINPLYNNFLEANDQVVLQRQGLINKANAPSTTPEQKAQLLDQASKLKPFMSNEVNTYNNYANDYNAVAVKLGQQPIPLLPTDRVLTKEEFALAYLTPKVVKQSKLNKEESLNPVWKELNDTYEKTLLKGMKSGGGKAPNVSRSMQDYLIQGIAPFTTKDVVEELYNSPTETYKQETVGDSVEFGKKTYKDQVIHKNGNRILTKLPDGKLIEYIGGDWQEVPKQEVSIDDKIIKGYVPTGGTYKNAILDNGKIKISYTEKDGTDGSALVDRVTYIKNIADSKDGYTATMDILDSYGISNLNDDENFRKAVELINTGTINGQAPTKGANNTAPNNAPSKTGLSIAEQVKAARNKK